LAGLPDGAKEVYAGNFIAPYHKVEYDVILAGGDVVFVVSIIPWDDNRR